MLIGDAAPYTGVSVRMLRHYDAVGLVRPTGRTIGGYRDYSDDDVRTILQVKTLRSLGLTLKQIRRILEDPGRAPAALVGDLVRQTEKRLDRERELLDRLRAIAASKPADCKKPCASSYSFGSGLGQRLPQAAGRSVLAGGRGAPCGSAG